MTKTSFIADIQTIKYNIFLDAFALTCKPGFGALLTINIIFEVQFFVGGLVVKIPAFG